MAVNTAEDVVRARVASDAKQARIARERKAADNAKAARQEAAERQRVLTEERRKVDSAANAALERLSAQGWPIGRLDNLKVKRRRDVLFFSVRRTLIEKVVVQVGHNGVWLASDGTFWRSWEQVGAYRCFTKQGIDDLDQHDLSYLAAYLNKIAAPE